MQTLTHRNDYLGTKRKDRVLTSILHRQFKDIAGLVSAVCAIANCPQVYRTSDTAALLFAPLSSPYILIRAVFGPFL